MIRFARETDIDKIMGFIDTFWRKGHILGVNREFFEYEHLLEEGVSYVISETIDGDINAILGYIPYGEKNRDIMTVMWKANHTAEPALGIALFNYLKDNADVRIMASPGSSKKLKGLYHYFGYQFGKMIQWYRLNSNVTSFHIARIEEATVPEVEADSEYTLYETWERLEAEFDFESYRKRNPKPYKEAWYIKKRYFDHPIYCYKVYGVKNDAGTPSLLMIFRLIDFEGARVLRLVDCIGEYTLISNSTNLLDSILVENDAEYVDCYEIGLNDEVMKKGGWIKTNDTANIIPNYFAPFAQENIDIFYFSTDPEIVLFKGDGDQDRPN